MRVLVVEDERYLAEAIRGGLRLEAIAADIAGDGDTALELLGVNAYDIAVLDREPALPLQMTANLLHNAIVHNLPGHGTVRLSTAIRPGSVTLTVENTGAELTPQLVATLTEPFQRGTQRVRGDHAGAGLGLAIVKTITQAHGGTLTLYPQAAGGLCVTVQLPAGRSGGSTS